jgi:hypothetical protein
MLRYDGAPSGPDRQRRTERTVRGQGAAVEAVVDRNEASALADLQMHWDEAYVIGFDGDVWSARFHGSADELCARTGSDLRELIRADYAHRQRPPRPTQAPVRGSAIADAGRTADDDPADDDPADYDDPAARSAEPLGPDDFAAIRGERMSM